MKTGICGQENMGYISRKIRSLSSDLDIRKTNVFIMGIQILLYKQIDISH